MKHLIKLSAKLGAISAENGCTQQWLSRARSPRSTTEHSLCLPASPGAGTAWTQSAQSLVPDTGPVLSHSKSEQLCSVGSGEKPGWALCFASWPWHTTASPGLCGALEHPSDAEQCSSLSCVAVV